MFAAARGHLDVVRILLEASADANSNDEVGSPPLTVWSPRVANCNCDGRDIPPVETVTTSRKTLTRLRSPLKRKSKC
jgi:hypothetical protein